MRPPKLRATSELIWKQEIEIAFLNDHPGKLEDDINKTSGIVYPSAKDGRAEICHLQQECLLLQRRIESEVNTCALLKTKVEFLNSLASMKLVE